MSAVRPASAPTESVGLASMLRARARSIVELAGSATAASWLGVPRSRLARWCRGDEQPAGEEARRLLDLELVLTRTLLV